MAAVASYLDARAQGGLWLVRMEDLDTDRNQSGAADSILRDLDAFGLHWDGEVAYQSRRLDLYRHALDQLQARGLVYPCTCSRKEIADSAVRAGDPKGQRYPGTCANGCDPAKAARSYRVRVSRESSGEAICFVDRWQGQVCQNVAQEIGDFVVKRADGPFAYQLAVVVDDAAQGVTDVVRGADLLDATPRQIHLQRLLGYPTPRYLHIPVVVDSQGFKLSKQTGATAVNRDRAAAELARAIRFLGLDVAETVSVGDMLQSATQAWARRCLTDGGTPACSVPIS